MQYYDDLIMLPWHYWIGGGDGWVEYNVYKTRPLIIQYLVIEVFALVS